MALDFRTVTINFAPTTGAPGRETATAVFGSTVTKANAALRGFDIRFNNGDHHILRELVDIDVEQILNNTVRVADDYLLRDSTGNIDDPYSGTVEVVVMADVA